MARARLDFGQPGSVTYRRLAPKVWQARCRFRDTDGATRQISAQGTTKTAAQTALNAKLTGRGITAVSLLKPSSTFAAAAHIWLDQVRNDQRGTTYTSYRQWLDGRVLPDLGEMRLAELRVPYLNAYFTGLRTRHGYTANTLRMIRKVVRGPLSLAVEHEALAANPMTHVRKIKGDAKAPRALTPDERDRLLTWLEATSNDPDEAEAQKIARRRDMPDIVRVMLGTGLRIGELLALRWRDVHLTGIQLMIERQRVVAPALECSGNIARVVGQGLVRHSGKTDTAQRTVLLAGFVLATLQRRHDRLREIVAPDAPVFAAMTRTGLGWRDPAKVSGWIRDVRQWVGLEWMTSHVWRKTAATIMYEAGVPTSIIAEQLGHKHLSMTEDVYIGRGTYSLDAPAALDAALGRVMPMEGH